MFLRLLGLRNGRGSHGLEANGNGEIHNHSVLAVQRGVFRSGKRFQRSERRQRL